MGIIEQLQNIFNFLVLAISDLFIKDNYIYSYADKYSMFYIFGGIFITILFAISILLKSEKKYIYIFISIIMIIIYFSVWYLQFI